MNPRMFVLALRARYGVFALALAATVAAAAIVSLVMPKAYKSTASLVVDTREEQSMRNAVDAFVQPNERIAYLQTQVDILTSKKVARQVVQNLDLVHNPAVIKSFKKHADADDSIEEWLIDGMLSSLKVETSQSSIIHVSYTDRDPEVAARIANAFAKAYLDTVLELRVQPMRNAAAWFDTQLKTLRANLEDAQAKLTEYQRREGIVSTDESQDLEYARLNELSKQLANTQQETIELQSRDRQARSDIARGSDLDQLPSVRANPYIQQMRADVIAAETKLQEMSRQYGVNHPAYKAQVAEIEARRDKLNAEMRRTVASNGAALRQSQARDAELQSAIASQRTRLLSLKEGRNELSVLNRNVETAQKTYETALERSVVSQVEGRANQANASVLTPAVAPSKPSQPKLRLNIALSMVLGTMLGLGLVLLLEMSDRRVRSLADLNEASHLPLLGRITAWRPTERLMLSGSRGARRYLPSPT
ncbi:MAG TPA: chain length determinant protein EpsF [Steroidobacteraceae bacterium]|nr:chain length determinant protein EpsF [Steroidobacteraceae bacterium]